MSTLEIASLAAAILLAASRLLKASERLWQYVPAPIRWLPPVLAVAIPQIQAALTGATTKLDLLETAILAVTLIVPGARTAAHAELAKKAAVLLVVLALPVVSACSSAPEKPACSPEQLAKLEVAFVAEATEACAGKKYDECEALTALREKYAVKRKAWVDCK